MILQHARVLAVHCLSYPFSASLSLKPLFLMPSLVLAVSVGFQIHTEYLPYHCSWFHLWIVKKNKIIYRCNILSKVSWSWMSLSLMDVELALCLHFCFHFATPYTVFIFQKKWVKPEVPINWSKAYLWPLLFDQRILLQALIKKNRFSLFPTFQWSPLP